MREIKFRGKGINGEWYIGLLSISQGLKGQPPKGYYISNKAGMPWAYQVIPETVGQYTGLKDKNGKEIYEGDILGLKVDGYWVAIGIVKYCGKKGSFFSGRYYLTGAEGYASDWAYEDEGDPSKWHCNKVIGNIYENPDLMGKGE